MNGGDFVFQVQYHDGAGWLSHVGDCRKHLLLPRWPAFIVGRSQADYLRSLWLHLERLIISKIGFLSFILKIAGARLKLSASSSACGTLASGFSFNNLSGLPIEH
jgi:hypothetical protein